MQFLLTPQPERSFAQRATVGPRLDMGDSVLRTLVQITLAFLTGFITARLGASTYDNDLFHIFGSTCIRFGRSCSFGLGPLCMSCDCQ